MMTIRNHGLHCLLALCVGLLPLSATGSMNMEHGTGMPMDCADCSSIQLPSGDSCQETDCHSIMQFCSAQSGSSFIPVWAWISQDTIRAIAWPGKYTRDYRHSLTEPIYRPPIT